MLPPCHLAILNFVRPFLCLLVLILPILPALHAQTQADGQPSSSSSSVFPFALVLDAAGFAASAVEIWRPDWHVKLPPDAFRLLSGGSSRITLEGEGFLLNFSHDPEGRVQEFPFMLNGKMAQVSLDRQDGEIRKVILSFPADENTWEFELLEYQDFSPAGDLSFGKGFPALVRASIGGAWYFITLTRWAEGITETWFDIEGNALGGYAFSLTRIGGNQRIRSIKNLFGDDNNLNLVYYYDSWGLINRISGPGGVYTVRYYRDALPRYWERQSTGGINGAFYFQWDAGGFLVRMVPGNENVEEPGGSARPVEYRFEYILDERGNWIERREIRMIHQSGLLFPSPGTIFRRILEYRRQ